MSTKEKMIDAYPIPKVCRHCGADVIFTSNAIIYGREFGNGKCYICTKCDAFVGVHDNSDIPLGILANKEERELKKRCHTLFDPVWKDLKLLNRSHAYNKLAKLLGISHTECHFGHFDKIMLSRCIEIVSNDSWYLNAS